MEMLKQGNAKSRVRYIKGYIKEIQLDVKFLYQIARHVEKLHKKCEKLEYKLNKKKNKKIPKEVVDNYREKLLGIKTKKKPGRPKKVKVNAI